MSLLAHTLIHADDVALTPIARPFTSVDHDAQENVAANEGSVVSIPIFNIRRDQTANPKSGARASQDFRDKLSGHADADFSACDLLFHMLTFVASDEQARQFADKLFQRFGSVGATLAASPRSIKALIDCDNDIVAFLKGLHLLASFILSEPIKRQCNIRNSSELHDYLRTSLAYETTEVVRLLLLDTRNALIQDVLHSTGSSNHTTIYPTKIIKQILDLNATSVIIVHNHPSGDPTPSVEDMETTILLHKTLEVIGIVLQDHIVVGKRRCVSMRSMGIFQRLQNA